MFELLSVPAIMAAVEAVKMAGLPAKYAALIAVVFGVAFGLGMGDVMSGLLFGLAASGLYSGAKAVIKK